MPALSFRSGGDWRIWDHGDPEVDAFWRRAVTRGKPLPSLGGAIPAKDAFYVPDEFRHIGAIPESYFICEDILEAS